MNRECFARQMTDLEEVYGGKISDREKKVLWNVLHHLSNDQMIDAIDAAIAQYQFRPRANQILELAEGKEEAITNQTALQEWENVVSLAKKSRDTKIELPMRTGLALRNIGGISVVMECPEADLHWKQKEFIEQYHEVGEIQKAMQVKQLPQPLEDALSPLNSSSVSDSMQRLSQLFTMPY